MDLEGSARALDWNDVRFFLAIARTRRLAKAAKVLGVDQTTVGRRLAALEERLRVELFVRTPAGWDLTPAGERVLQSAQRMAEAAEELSAHAVAEDGRIEGLVRIATSDTLAEYFVVPAIRAVQARYPAIRAVVNTGFARVDLLRGDADLAIRLVRPTDPRLAYRRFAEHSFRLYASREYLQERGMPDSLVGHPIITYDEAMRLGGQPFRHLQTEGLHVALQANTAHVLLAAAVAGIGIVQLPDYVGDTVPGLVHVLPNFDKPYRVWLVVAQAKRRVAAIRVVSDAILATRPRRAGDL
ncbi:LysR family transcriptional regulator [Pendulispora rubella]|uniref:LysR family transcriptional regulator n=1 Tax=Pendulispora rubella TaxID=2741070 RepID=A0ABZ2L6C4_9BACT